VLGGSGSSYLRFCQIFSASVSHKFTAATSALPSLSMKDLQSMFSFGSAAYQFYSTQAESWKKSKRPNAKWESRNHVQLSDDIIKLPKVLLDEALEVPSFPWTVAASTLVH
jgi:hypothetical protein